MIWEILVAPFAEFGFMRRALVGTLRRRSPPRRSASS